VRGDPAHPANRGKLCVKGSALGETVDLGGRLLHPQVRGVQTSWDEAIGTVAREFRRILLAHGPESVAFYVSGQLLTEDYYVANKLMKGYLGAANIDTNSRLCMASSVAGHKRAFGEDVVPVINRIAQGFRNVVITQDWHTPGHASFATTYPGKKAFETTRLAYGTQVLWPDHCVQGSDDAALHKDLNIAHAQVIVRKGYNKGVDSYSAFEEADRKTSTGLGGYLKQRGIKTVFVTGLATDFCVAWTAMDARKAGFASYVVEDATRAIDLNGSLAAAWKQMAAKGVKRIQSGDLDVA